MCANALTETDPVDLSLLPASAKVVDGRISVGGCDLLEVAEEFGTPLFVYDAAELRNHFTEAVEHFGPGVAYATKAFLTPGLAKLASETGISFDVSTGGEYECVRRAGVDASRLVMHGNNKQPDELRRAVVEGVQWIVVDNFDELDRLETLAAELGQGVDLLVRINPGIEVHTHEFISTGNRDSKFGFPTWTDDAARAIERIRDHELLRFKGIHLHIGSFVLQIENFIEALDTVAPMVRQYSPDVMIVGGGLGVRYLNEDECPSFADWAQAILAWGRETLPGVTLLAEPGRSMVAQAGLTLYTLGSLQTKGDRTFAAVDGGMSDNPRPMLYDSGYEAFSVNDPQAERPVAAQVVGRHCESGDIVVPRAFLPESLTVGDVVCTPVTGAYGYTMASNYNMVARPAVVFVEDGTATLMTRRETYDDLFAREVGF